MNKELNKALSIGCYVINVLAVIILVVAVASNAFEVSTKTFISVNNFTKEYERYTTYEVISERTNISAFFGNISLILVLISMIGVVVMLKKRVLGQALVGVGIVSTFIQLVAFKLSLENEIYKIDNDVTTSTTHPVKTMETLQGYGFVVFSFVLLFVAILVLAAIKGAEKIKIENQETVD